MYVAVFSALVPFKELPYKALFGNCPFPACIYLHITEKDSEFRFLAWDLILDSLSFLEASLHLCSFLPGLRYGGQLLLGHIQPGKQTTQIISESADYKWSVRECEGVWGSVRECEGVCGSVRECEGVWGMRGQTISNILSHWPKAFSHCPQAVWCLWLWLCGTTRCVVPHAVWCHTLCGATRCVVPLRVGRAMFCHAGSGRAGRVWSARGKSRAILFRGSELNPATARTDSEKLSE